MIDPVFFLGLSLLLVAVSLTAVLVVLIPATLELARAARSAEKLFDTLSRDLPPTLEAIRLTGMEISDLTDDVSEGVRSAGQVARRVDQSLEGAKKQVQQVRVTTRSVFAGVKAAWRTLTYAPTPNTSSYRRGSGRLPASHRPPLDPLANASPYAAEDDESYDRELYPDQYDSYGYGIEGERSSMLPSDHRASTLDQNWEEWSDPEPEGLPQPRDRES